MKVFIDYMVGKAANSNLTSRIDMKVKEAIEKRFWRKEYMTFKEQMDQEFNRGIEQGIEQGIEKGIEKGIELGTDKHLIELICKKLKKDKNINIIAEEVEEPIEKVKGICDIAAGFAPDYDVEKIYEAMSSKKE